MAELAAKRDHDIKWEDGRCFGAIYDGGPGVREVAERAASLYLHEELLDATGSDSSRLDLIKRVANSQIGYVRSYLGRRIGIRL